MITEFEEGETYTNPKLDQDIMVLGIVGQTADASTLSILWVDRDTTESTKFGQLEVSKKDLGDWSVKNYD